MAELETFKSRLFRLSGALRDAIRHAFSEADETSFVFQAGLRAYRDGRGISNCPHTSELLRRQWRDGWRRGDAERMVLW